MPTTLSNNQAPEDFSESILTSIKKMLGTMYESENVFDTDIIIWINSAFMVLTQLGVGPKTGFSITGDSEKWTDFVQDASILSGAKSYVYMRTKLGFDSSTLPSSVITSYEKMIQDYEWRLNVAAD